MSGPRLDHLPFDVLHHVSTFLGYRDYIHLSRVNRALRDAMRSKYIAQKIVEDEMLYSKEGQKAVRAQKGYHRAISRYFTINEAVAVANPYFVSVLTYGTDFLYQQGILCYCTGFELRLLDVHQTAKVERVINFFNILRRLVPSLKVHDSAMPVKLVHYGEDTVVFRVLRNTGMEGSMDLLCAMDVGYRHGPSSRKRLLLQAEVPTGASIFARSNRSCIWYGYSTAAHPNDDVPWRIYAINLLSAQSIEYPLQRRLNGDLGQTVCFEVYNEALYAISTVEKADDTLSKTSFYYWFSYTTRRQPQTCYARLWRRENCEGPIDDSWTNLSIRIDERTGQPVIIECRREWPRGKSEKGRTSYIRPLPTLEGALDGDFTKIRQSNSDPAEIAIETFRENPNQRSCHSYHTEFDQTNGHSTRREFIAAHTIFHTYHLSAASFLDLVNDRTAEGGFRYRDGLRIRAVSRTSGSPIDENGTGLLFKAQTDVDGRHIQGSEERFTNRGVHLWPPEDSCPGVISLLSPSTRAGTVRAVFDEQSLIYSISIPNIPQNQEALILVSFDPAIRLPNIHTLRSSKPSTTEDTSTLDMPKLETLSGSFVRLESPLYHKINNGFWLR